MPEAMTIYAGCEAAKRLQHEGWHADLFSVLIGASGGPKMFALSQLDRALFRFLQTGTQPLAALGSSIGAWRNACLAQDDPDAAMDRLEQGYLAQRYDSRPSVAEISQFSRNLLDDVLGDEGAQQIIQHPRITSHIVTARGRGPTNARSTPLLAVGMAGAAIANTVHRNLLSGSFQRVTFHSGQKPYPHLPLPGFSNRFIPLQPDNIKPVLHATGSIPFLLAGDRDIPGAPAGHYWDGGIIDYHFDPAANAGDGLILYPHFGSDMITGWLDKFLPWRRNNASALDKVVVICPSDAFIASLPGSKIPDRRDFTQLDTDTRMKHWLHTIERCKTMADEFNRQIEGSNPLQGVRVLKKGAKSLK